MGFALLRINVSICGLAASGALGGDARTVNTVKIQTAARSQRPFVVVQSFKDN